MVETYTAMECTKLIINSAMFRLVHCFHATLYSWNQLMRFDHTQGREDVI